MRLYGAIEKVVPLEDGTVRVHGIASSEAVDDQSEIVSGSAIRAALPDYMRFPALREMHQLSAAGTTLEAEVGDDAVTRIVAHVVDPIAVSKVKNHVYRGFSIGGRVTQREAGNPKCITGLVLNEISLVDRPANPEAIFDIWKASSMQEFQPATAAPFNPPIQIWACGDASHRHVAKADALKCLEKQAAGGVDNSPENSGSADAGEEQQPEADIEKQAADGAASAQELIDAALKAVESGEVALAKANPDDAVTKDNGDGGDMGEAAKDGDGGDMGEAADAEDGPPKKRKAKAKKTSQADLDKSLWDIGECAELIGRLKAMCERLEIERAAEGDASMAPDSCEAACASACALLRVLCAEATQEILDGTEIAGPVGPQMSAMMMSAIAESLAKAIPDSEKVEHLMEALDKANRRHSASTQARLDGVSFATNKAMDVGDLKRAEMISTGDAHKAVLDAGAVAWGQAITGREMLTDGNPSGDAGMTTHATVDTGGNGQTSAPNPTGASPASPFPKVAKTADQGWLADIEAMVKANKGGRALLRAAHDLLSAACDGATCKEDAAKPAHISGRDMAAMHKCHGHLMAVDGVKCDAGGAPATANEAKGPVAGDTVKVAEGVDVAMPPALSDWGKTNTPVPAEHVWEVARLERDDLSKALASERAEKAELVKTIGAIVPMLDRLTKRVDQIADTPMPARAIANTAVIGITKAQDGGGSGGQPPTVEEIAAELAKLSKEDQTVALIKMSQSHPRAYDPVKRIVA